MLLLLLSTFTLWGEPEGGGSRGISPAWVRAVGGKITSWQAQGPDGMIYLTAQDQALHAVDPDNGADKWFFRPGGRLTGFLAVSPDGTIFIQNEENQIYAVNPGGEARWRCLVEGRVSSMPVLTPEGTLIFLLDKGTLAAISRKGEILWIADGGRMPTSSPVIDYRGFIYLAREGGIDCYDLDGERQWSLQAEGINRLAVDDEGLIYGLTRKGRILCFNHQGSRQWDSGTEPGEVATLAMVGDNVLVQTYDGLVFKINNEGGENFFQGSSPLNPGFVDREGRVVFFDRDFRLCRLSFEEGRETVLYQAPAKPTPPLVTTDGLVVFGTDQWRLYGLSGFGVREGWSQLRANSRRDGSLYAVLSREERKGLYEDDAKWLYYNYLLDSDDSDAKRDLLNAIESHGEDRTELDREIPFWDLLLMEMLETRDDALFMAGDEGTRDNPLIRAEAYRLLGEWAVYPARNTIIGQMRKEEDPLPLTWACFALGQIASDWDGRSVRAIARVLRKPAHLSDPTLVATAVMALKGIMEYNGGDVAEECWDIFMSLTESPLVSESVKKSFFE